MYKKYAVMLVMLSLIFGFAYVSLQEQVFITKLGEYNEISFITQKETIQTVFSREVISGHQPLLEVQSVEWEGMLLSDEDKMILYKIVEAEAGSEDRIGKILVANVVLNRLADDSFPDTVEGIVFQQEAGVAQFSPVANGRYYSAIPEEDTIEAVEAALRGEDYSDGALYFMARKYADGDNVKWFDDNLDCVLVHGGHEFYK